MGAAGLEACRREWAGGGGRNRGVRRSACVVVEDARRHTRSDGGRGGSQGPGPLWARWHLWRTWVLAFSLMVSHRPPSIHSAGEAGDGSGWGTRVLSRGTHHRWARCRWNRSGALDVGVPGAVGAPLGVHTAVRLVLGAGSGMSVRAGGASYRRAWWRRPGTEAGPNLGPHCWHHPVPALPPYPPPPGHAHCSGSPWQGDMIW